MPNYRFAFHTRDERLTGEERRSFANDEAAIAFARALSAQHPIVMVWHGDQFVKRVVKLGTG